MAGMRKCLIVHGKGLYLPLGAIVAARTEDGNFPVPQVTSGYYGTELSQEDVAELLPGAWVELSRAIRVVEK